MIERKKTRTVKVGRVKIGGSHPVSIQSMTKTDTRNVTATVKQIKELQAAGCEIVRLAVKDMEAAKAIGAISRKVDLPIVADIHFDHRLALEAIQQGADKIRINPGNMSKKEHLDLVIDAARRNKIPIRIGANSGSISRDPLSMKKMTDKMVGEVLKYAEYFKKRKFEDIVISLKASDVESTIKAYRKISGECSYPLHLGVTAAGILEDGIVRSSVGIGALLVDGIGDTLRVSLTGDPKDEVYAAKRILSSLNLRHFGPEIIACPTCGRCQVDLVKVARELDLELKRAVSKDRALVRKQMVVAVMGCEVNGPGEARNADIGIAFGKGRGMIFKKGKMLKTVASKDAVRELIRIVTGG